MKGQHTTVRGRGTQLFLAIAAVTAAVVALLLPSFASVVSMWPLSLYRYAYLILPVSGYLLWQQRDALAAQPVRASWAGLGIVLMLTAALIVGRATMVQAIEHLAAVMMIPAVVLTILGTAVFRTAAFPLLLLIAAAPVYEPVVPPLMILTADIAELLLRLVGQPFLRSGQIFELPGGSFHVADVCAGLRYLLAGVVTATVFAHQMFGSWRKQWIFVAVAASAFILANAIRAFVVMYVYSATSGSVFGEGHNGFGLALFAAVMLALLWIGRRFADRTEPGSAADAVADSLRIGRPSMIATAATVAVLMTVPLAHARRDDLSRTALAWPPLPPIEGCGAPREWSASWGPFMVGSDAERAGSYDCGGVTIDVFVAAYGTQRPGKELISVGNELLPDSKTSRSRRSTASFEDGTGHAVSVDELEVLGDRPEVLWTWYSVGDAPASTGVAVKAREAMNALRFGSDPSAIYVVAVRGALDSTEQAREYASVAARATWRASEPGRNGHVAE